MGIKTKQTDSHFSIIMKEFLYTFVFAIPTLLFLVDANPSNSLKYLTKRAKLYNYSVTVLDDLNALNKTWVEYKLLLLNTNRRKNMTQMMLTVGVPIKTDFFPDCYLRTMSATMEFDGYSLRVLWELQKVLRFK